MDTLNKLFVYGSLGPGRPNEHILSVLGGTWQEASVTGTLHNEGWGAKIGYPAISLDAKGEKIEGFLFSSDKLSQYWDTLDDFEGEAYTRVVTSVRLRDASTTNAYIYALSQF